METSHISMQNHVLSVSAGIWYKDWEEDVQSWMLTKNVRIHENQSHSGQAKKAKRMRHNCFRSYMNELRGCKDLVQMLIKQPILNWCTARSAAQPAKTTKLIKRLTSLIRKANDPPSSGPVAHELRGRCETQAESDKCFEADNEDHEPAASNPKWLPKPRHQKRSLARASRSWSSAEQPAESCNP